VRQEETSAGMEEISIDIIRNCQNGSAESFAAVVETYEKPIFSYLYKLSFRSLATEEVEDLVQEIFLKAYCNIHTFDLRRGSKFSTWLYTIARNHYLSAMRKKSVETTDMDGSEISTFHNDAAQTPRDEVLEKERSQKVADAIALLPEEQKSALLMQYYEGLTYQEIAIIMSCSPGTVKSRLSRAREKLYEYLKGYL
jgi:RNA polymerase sigma-70 factor (ECF subfamily)